MRLIDADELKRDFCTGCIENCPNECDEIQIINSQPTIEAEPVRRGRWIRDGYDFQHGNDWIHCSECGKRGINVPADLTNYCPNCGAKMEEEHEDILSMQ